VTEKLADDLLIGVPAISEELGEKPRRTYHLLEKGSLPAFKVLGKWYARRSTLRAHIDRLDSGQSAA
jgi:hypothetical protein